jgi:hypothetical protein
MLEEYKKNYEELSSNTFDNVYSLEEYKNRKSNRGPDDIIKYSSTHNLVWSEKEQEYSKVPINSLSEDEEL